MFAYLKGLVTEKNFSSSNFILEVTNIGYEIFSNAKTLSQLETKTEKTIFTVLASKDDGMKLWGFLSRVEKELFELLTTVSGVGPKAALSILNVLNVDDLISAVLREKAELISQAQGVGEKTAKRVILELKNKLSKINSSKQLSQTSSFNSADDVSSILSNLGFSAIDIDRKLSAAKEKGLADDVEGLIRYCMAT